MGERFFQLVDYIDELYGFVLVTVHAAESILHGCPHFLFLFNHINDDGNVFHRYSFNSE